MERIFEEGSVIRKHFLWLVIVVQCYALPRIYSSSITGHILTWCLWGRHTYLYFPSLLFVEKRGKILCEKHPVNLFNFSDLVQIDLLLCFYKIRIWENIALVDVTLIDVTICWCYASWCYASWCYSMLMLLYVEITLC